MTSYSTYRFLSDLLDTLAADGFDMGIGRHLQVQELLSKLPEDLPLASFKTLLAPLFATNRQDQERFYELFDQALHREETFQKNFVTPTPSPVPPEVKQVYLWRNVVLALLAALAGVAGLIFDTAVWSTWLLALGVAAFAVYFAIASLASWNRRILYWVLVVLLSIVGYFFKKEKTEPAAGKAFYQPFAVTPGEAHHLPISVREDSLLDITFFNKAKRDTNDVLGTLQLDAPDSTCCFTLVARDSFPRDLNDTIIVLNVYPNFSDTTYFIAQYQKPVKATSEIPEDTSTPALDTLPIPYPRDISELYIDAKLEARAAFYRQYAWMIKLALSLLFGGILWAIVQWRERKRRRLVAELDRQDRPPYVWNLKIENAEAIAFGEAIPLLLNQLRRRRFSEAFRLDVPRTVTATVRSAGRVDFKFKQLTSPPDYLLLIDRHNHSDHRALLFNRLYEVFRANEVTIERFYYQGDPRLCFNEAHPDGIGLKELQHRFGEARLLLVGNGYDMLSPLSGKPAKWVNIFSNWRERALFSPQPLGTWGRKEAALGDLFYLMPASIEGFTATLDEFGSTDPRQPNELIAKLEDVPWRPIELDGDLLRTLCLHYPEKVVQWIAACAVYPTLHWDLTLHLGRELSTEAEPLLTLDNLFALTRLPWFIEGHIPDAAREELIAYLQQVGLENHVRESLHRLFEQTPQPAADSVAYEDYRVNALTNELLFTTNRLRRRKLRAELDRYLAAGTEPDVVNFKYLQARQRSLVDFVVPEKWKEYFSKAGNALGGWKDWMWALPLWVLVVAGVWLYQPNFKECQGIQIVYKQQVLCIENANDCLLYYDYLIRDEIENQNWKFLDSINNLIKTGTFDLCSQVLFYGTIFTKDTGVDTIRTEKIKDDALIQANFSDNAFYIAKDILYADSLSFLQNISTYYYNAGVKLHNQWRHLQDSIQTLSNQGTNKVQQQSNNIGFSNARYRSLQLIADSLAAQSCDNFTRGYALYQQLPDTTRARTQQVGYSFELALRRVCKDTAVAQDTLPAIETIALTVKVTDAQTGKPIPNAQVRALNGTITAGINQAGNYQLRVPRDWRDSTLSVRFISIDYEERIVALPINKGFHSVSLKKIVEETKTSIITQSYYLQPSFIKIASAKEDVSNFNIGIKLFDSKNFENAITFFNKIKNKNVLFLETQYLLAHCYYNLKEYQKAIQHLNVLKGKEASLRLLFGNDYQRVDKQEIEWFKVICLFADEQQEEGMSLLDKIAKEPRHKYNKEATSLIKQISYLKVIEPEMVLVRGGTFTIGCLEKRDGECRDDEKPAHDVKVNDFYISKYEVTQAQWRAVMGSDPPELRFKGCDPCPVENVSWNEIQDFLKKLNEKTGNLPAGRQGNYRLPTEAQWEYAARGGANSRNYQYAGSNNMDEVAWYIGNSRDQTHPVGQKKANELGIHDMSGNVWEWCSDWYGEKYYAESGNSNNPIGTTAGRYRVVRGGSWDFSPDGCRAASRNGSYPDLQYNNFGFRLARY